MIRRRMGGSEKSEGEIRCGDRTGGGGGGRKAHRARCRPRASPPIRSMDAVENGIERRRPIELGLAKARRLDGGSRVRAERARSEPWLRVDQTCRPGRHQGARELIPRPSGGGRACRAAAFERLDEVACSRRAPCERPWSDLGAFGQRRGLRFGEGQRRRAFTRMRPVVVLVLRVLGLRGRRCVLVVPMGESGMVVLVMRVSGPQGMWAGRGGMSGAVVVVVGAKAGQPGHLEMDEEADQGEGECAVHHDRGYHRVTVRRSATGRCALRFAIATLGEWSFPTTRCP